MNRVSISGDIHLFKTGEGQCDRSKGLDLRIFNSIQPIRQKLPQLWAGGYIKLKAR